MWKSTLKIDRYCHLVMFRVSPIFLRVVSGDDGKPWSPPSFVQSLRCTADSSCSRFQVFCHWLWRHQTHPPWALESFVEVNSTTKSLYIPSFVHCSTIDLNIESNSKAWSAKSWDLLKSTWNDVIMSLCYVAQNVWPHSWIISMYTRRAPTSYK